MNEKSASIVPARYKNGAFQLHKKDGVLKPYIFYSKMIRTRIELTNIHGSENTSADIQL